MCFWNSVTRICPPERSSTLRWLLRALLPTLAVLIAPAGCRPQAVDRAASVRSSDGSSAADVGGPAPSYPDAGATPADAAVGTMPAPDAAALPDARLAPPDAVVVAPPRPDAAPPPPDAPPVVLPPDASPDTAPDQIAAVLALASPTVCAMKVSRDYDLRTPPELTDGGVRELAAMCGLKGAVYWVADMNIACDGRNTPGKCDGDHDTDTLVHNSRNQALAASVTPYVVVPSEYANAGLKPGAVVAVIDNATRAVTFAVFGDSSGTSIGSASYACAEKLGLDPQPDTGGRSGKSVTYVAFVGAGAVPGDIENQTTTAQLGRMLLTKLLVDNK
jgi:hypothetical protein